MNVIALLSSAISGWEMMIIFLVIIYLGTALDVVISKFQNNTQQLVWLVIVLFAPFWGTLIYLSIGGRYKLP